MTNKKIYSIEDAMRKSIPENIHSITKNNPKLIDLINSNKGYFSLGNGQHGLKKLKYSNRNDKSKKKLLDATIELNISGEDYLDTYKKLLKNPNSIMEYVELVNPIVKEDLFKNCKKNNFSWIKSLFGINDHSKIDIYFQTKNNTKLSDIANRINNGLINDIGFTPDDSMIELGLLTAEYNRCRELPKNNRYLTRNMPSLIFWGAGEVHEENKISLGFASEFQVLPNEDERNLICIEGFEKIIEYLKSLNPTNISFYPGDKISVIPEFQNEYLNLENKIK